MLVRLNQSHDTTMKKTLRVALAFARYDKNQLNCFAILVLLCLKNNPLFPNPPVSRPALADLVTTYQNALTAAAQGGPKDRAAFREARDELVLALRSIAAYIHSLGLKQESEVLSSGFDLAVWDTRQTPLTTPELVRLDNSVSTRLSLKLRAVPNAKTYQVQTSADGGQTWQELGIFPHTRGIVLTDLTPGKVYSLRVRAIGGSTRYSPWSAAISRMAT